MPTPFLSSEEYDERAHALYNEGQYDEALDLLREGLSLYPHAVELHVGVGYARLARDEFAWQLMTEVATVQPGFAIDEAPASLGRDLKLPPWEEPHRAEIERGLAPVTY